MALWWLWPGLVFWKAKAAGSGHGFNPIKFSSKILKNFHFEFFFVCGIVYTDVKEVFWILNWFDLLWRSLWKKKLLKLLVLIHIPKSLGLGQARPRPSHVWWLWPGLVFEEAKATSGQAKAGAFRPSRARTALAVKANIFERLPVGGASLGGHTAWWDHIVLSRTRQIQVRA